jgi:hypothetical protein
MPKDKRTPRMMLHPRGLISTPGLKKEGGTFFEEYPDAQNRKDTSPRSQSFAPIRDIQIRAATRPPPYGLLRDLRW